MAGIAKAKALGKYRGRRKSTVDPATIAELKDLGAAEIARRLNVSRATVYRRAPAGTFAGPSPIPPRPTFNVWAGDRLVEEGFDTIDAAQAEARRLSEENGVTHEVRPSSDE